MNTSIFETFGKYQLTERLAFGGMAEVFLATVHGEAGFVKPVVIKRLHPRLNEDLEFVQMLIDEARITAQLAHTNICQVLDLGSVDGSYYLAMEFISGEDLRTLQDHCKRNGVMIPTETAIYIVSEVLAGLDYAHRKESPDGQLLGIVHRDISPQNVLISYEGEVKVIDFGIAKARMRIVQTEAGVIKGKFRYMSPEQASGGQVDHRSDVFAAGVVLYELLRGGPHSMDVPDTEVLRRMRRAEFEPLRQFRPEIPVVLEKLVKKALQVKPAQRYRSAGEFREALLGYLEQTGVRFGRSDLALVMKDVFDADRRRRRSGSFSGPVSLPPRDAAFFTPHAAQEPTVARGSERASARRTGERPGAGDASQRSVKGWVAFAPTATQVPDTEEQEPLVPTDAMGTQALERLPTTDLELNPAGAMVPDPSIPGDNEQTFAYYALSDSDLIDDVSVPTAANPTRDEAALGLETNILPGRATRDRARSEGASLESGAERADRARSAQKAPEREPDARARVTGPSRPPTVSTGLFAQQGSTQIRDPAPDPGRPASRTLLGVGAVVLFGVVLAVTLYLMERPLDLHEESSPDQGSRAFHAADAALRADLKRATDPRRVRRGVINVQSQPPGAQISLCGKATGLVTPAKIRGRVGRSCVVELVLDGHSTYRMSVTPQAGRLTTIVATLRRRRAGGAAVENLGGRGILRVTSIQVGTVYVDNKQAGTTPRADIRLLPGSYTMRVHFKGLDQYSRPRTVTVSAGQTTRVHVDPAP